MIVPEKETREGERSGGYMTENGSFVVIGTPIPKTTLGDIANRLGKNEVAVYLPREILDHAIHDYMQKRVAQIAEELFEIVPSATDEQNG